MEIYIVKKDGKPKRLSVLSNNYHSSTQITVRISNCRKNALLLN